MYIFGMRELGFYLLEGGPKEEEAVVPNAVSIVATEGDVMVESLLLDLKDMVDEVWD